VPTVATNFWVAISCSIVNLFFAAFVLPESIDKARLKAAQKSQGAAPKQPKVPRGGVLGMLKRLIGPLMIFAPRRRDIGNGERRRDWSLTLLACAFFGYVLSMVGFLFLHGVLWR